MCVCVYIYIYMYIYLKVSSNILPTTPDKIYLQRTFLFTK